MFLYNIDGNLNNNIFVDTWDTEQLDQVHMYILYLLVSI